MSLFEWGAEELLPYDFSAVMHPDVWDPHQADELMSRLSAELAWQQVHVEVFNRRVAQPRLTCWYGDPGRSYSYSGTQLDPLPWAPILTEIKHATEKTVGATFNSVLANLYRSGSDSISWHSDNEAELGPEPVIASVSFGSVRRFDMRHRSTKKIVRVHLTPGSVLAMSGQSQSHWQHRIAKTRKPTAPRVNLTFRTIHV